MSACTVVVWAVFAGSAGIGDDSIVWSLAGLPEDVLSMYAHTRSFPVMFCSVCGDGLARIAAAVAAARGGADTLHVERMGFSGGFFTAVIGSAFDGWIDTRSGRSVVGGVVFEMLQRMDVLGGRDPCASCFTYNGEISQVAEHPDWFTPTTEPEQFE